MTNKLLLPLLGAMTLFALPVLAQETPASTPQAVAPYKTAIGFRTSFGGSSGTHSDLRLKHFIKPETALELQVGQLSYRDTYQASLHYIWQPQLLSTSRLRPYAGIGIGAVGTTRNRLYEKQDLEMGAVVLGSVGIEYTFRKLPLSVSLDYRHTLLGLSTSTFQYRGYSSMNSVGLGLKYTFGK
ncbi:hypothetical protein GCM10028895_35450 [Pontibacter rugosus]